jgi:hypothetical protein
MLSEIHFLLTYQCNFECDHCFLYCRHDSPGTFTISQVDQVLGEAKKMGTVETVYFEGGEPTLFYPLLLESIRRARRQGFQAGIVSNAYGALSEEDARLWLQPLVEAGLNVLSVSDDSYHYEGEKQSPASLALKAAQGLDLEAFPISIDPPQLIQPDEDEKGHTIIGGGVMFRGRAADQLADGLPTRPWTELRDCPHEDLVDPSRVHVDAFGNIHICQGISLGNFWEKPLSEIMADYRPEDHPICGPLHRGGPAGLIDELHLPHREEYVDECQACYLLRRELLDSYPTYLTPRQVYGF